MVPWLLAPLVFALLAAAPARNTAISPARNTAINPAFSPSGGAVSAGDVLERFHTWFERLRRSRDSLEGRPQEEMRTMIGDLRTSWALDPVRENDIALVLLDFMGWCTPAANVLGAQSRASEARELSLEALRAHVDPEFTRWITRDILAVRSQPLERRVAALAVLAPDHGPALLLPLLSCAREDEPRIRMPALEQLVGWDDPGVHALFLDELARGSTPEGHVPTTLVDQSTGAWSLAEAHFGKVMLAPLSPFAARLAGIVEHGLASSDWREVSRAVSLSRPLEAEAVIPFLIEALRRWKAREEAGVQALRVEMEIVRALENRSGRKLGLMPTDWSAWWRALSRGELKGAGPETGRYHEGTRPGFFGLHPATDRVTFVIDRSGSMDTALVQGTDGPKRTRWQEAVEQLLGFLDGIGKHARFSVILFHEYSEEWRPTLLDANEENKKTARAWLTGNHPGGGTALQGAISRAMRIAPDGTPDLAVLEADTIIVLCDGETAEGPGWVEPFLRTANQRARVVFHCVQIGAGGDGTLEKLAAGTGGDFVRVDG
jgi:hypothetical protein